MIHVNIFTDHPYTQTGFTHRQILCPDFKTDAIRETHRPGDHITPTHLLQNNPENASSLIKSSKPENFKENYCFPTPKNPVDPQQHNTSQIQKRILKKLLNIQKLDFAEVWKQFLTNAD